MQMKYFNSYFFLTTLASASLLTFTPLAYAADLSGNFDVTMTVASMCTIDTTSDGNVAFGIQPSIATNIQVNTASIDVTCTQGSPYTVALNSGGNADGTSRRMVGQTLITEFVAYQIYSDATYLSTWGDSTTFGAVKAAIGAGSSQNHVIYARVPSANALAQDYKDTVTATITW